MKIDDQVKDPTYKGVFNFMDGANEEIEYESGFGQGSAASWRQAFGRRREDNGLSEGKINTKCRKCIFEIQTCSFY